MLEVKLKEECFLCVKSCQGLQSWSDPDILMNGLDLHVLCRKLQMESQCSFKEVLSSLSLSLSLHVQTSMNRKQAENVAKKKLDNLMKESKIRDREDPDSFTITSLPPSAKPHEKSTVKVQTSLFCFSSFIYIHLKQLPKFIGWFKLVSRSGFWFNRWSSLKFYVTESSPREWLFCMYNAVKLCRDVWNKTS